MSLMVRCPRGAAVFRVAEGCGDAVPEAWRSEDEEEDASALLLVGGSLIVKSGTPVDMDVVGMADCVEMVPPGVRSPEGVRSPVVEPRAGTPRLCPLALLRCASPLPMLLAAYESNGLRSSALFDEEEALGVVCGQRCQSSHCDRGRHRSQMPKAHLVLGARRPNAADTLEHVSHVGWRM